MRMKIIRRFAAGTIGVCFTYALIRMPIAAINNPRETLAEWSKSIPAVTTEATQPETRYSATEYTTTIPETTYYQAPTEQTTAAQTTSPTEAFTEAVQNEQISEDDRSTDNNYEEEWNNEPENAGGDVPTLEQFLQSMSCGGCRHNCLLISPRCMKGRAKAESATVEYYETYGA